MADIAETLLPMIEDDFNRRISNDKNVQRFLKRVESGEVSPSQATGFAQTYANNLGVNLSLSLSKYLTQENMPDGKFYWNIVERIVTPMFKRVYSDVYDVLKITQYIVDKNSGINIGTIKADFPAARVKQICEGIADESADYETIRRRMEEPVVNVCRSFKDDFVEANALFRDGAGITNYIERTAEADCCEWCSKMEGKWRYGEEPQDVYKRHTGCNCTVTFYSAKERFFQNVHTKEKKYEENVQLTRYSPEEAEALQNSITKKKRA